jgi:acyl carrier protein
MTPDDLMSTIRHALYDVAPELEDEEIDPDLPLRDQTELDSMDFLNLAIALHEATGVEIPEADYPKLQSLTDIVGYLGARLH